MSYHQFVSPINITQCERFRILLSLQFFREMKSQYKMTVDFTNFYSLFSATWCVGQACSMGSLLLAAGSPGMRYSLPNSRIMIHQPSGGAHGQATDILIHAEEIIKIKRQLNEIYVKHTGKDLSYIEANMERDKFMSPQEAQEFGLIDKILEHVPKPENTE